MVDLVTPTEFSWGIDTIKSDFDKIVDIANKSFKKAFREEGQLCLVHTDDWTTSEHSKIHEGAGDIRLAHCPVYGKTENQFVNFVDEFKDTIFYDIWKEFPARIGRMRITKMPPKSLFRMHPDPFTEPPNDGSRYHMAIHTNEHCYITFPYMDKEPDYFTKFKKDNNLIDPFTPQLDWPNGYMFHVPDDGRLYKMDARPWHTSFNAGHTDRYHLLFNGY